MGKLPKNYFGPKQRITKLKQDHPKTESAIKTSATCIVVGETITVLIKATVEINDKIVAEGHAFTDRPEDDKAVEKAETIAIGRALVNAGYPETLDEEDGSEDQDEPAEKKPSKGLGGLGKASKRVKEEIEEEETDDEPASKTEKKSGLGSKLGKAKPVEKPAATEEDGDGDEEDDEEETEDAEEEKPAKEEVVASPGRMSREELLAKYRKK